MKRRLVALLCILCMLSSAMTFTSHAMSSEVKIVGTGLTLLWERYVIYDYNGTRLRSDSLTPKFSNMLWEKLDDENKQLSGKLR